MAMTEEKTKTQRGDNIENLDQYMLHGKSEIMQRFKQLAKGKSMVTAHYENGSTMNTLVIDVIRDMDLVVLDYGVDEKQMQQLLQSGRVIFKSQFEGVTVQFSTNSLTKAKFQNEAVIAIPIPASMLWLQRRQAYRVKVPRGMPSSCEIPLKDGRSIRLGVFDISVGGISLSDDTSQIEVENGQVLENCTLDLPGHGKFVVHLDIRAHFPVNKHKPAAGQRLGCSFRNIGMTDGAIIQRYIHSIETLRKRTED